jgi:hypothetical protein
MAPSEYNPKNPDLPKELPVVEFSQEGLPPEPPPLEIPIDPIPEGATLTRGDFQSPNFKTGSSGWRLRSNGDFEGNSGTFRGNLRANSIDIPDTTTANSFHVDSMGNTWWGGTTLATALASITKAGQATFQGMTSLNMKAFTNFEGSARFISTLINSGTTTFGNQGVTVAPGVSSTSSARLLWWISQYVFNNNPTFTCSFLALGSFSSGDGRAYIGLGAPTLTGSVLQLLSINCVGFRFQKVSGVTTMSAANNNADGSNYTETNLTTVADNDSMELFIKMSATDIKFYYRKNGGTLTLGATHTTRIPTASENYIMVGVTNSAGTDNFQFQMQCASYEH